ncbi:hypothetical protein MMC24_006960 [Lignoscripta atroalba]|nr:hypothetical protein [Lignoscripta atroalba]
MDASPSSLQLTYGAFPSGSGTYVIPSTTAPAPAPGGAVAPVGCAVPAATGEPVTPSPVEGGPGMSPDGTPMTSTTLAGSPPADGYESSPTTGPVIPGPVGTGPSYPIGTGGPTGTGIYGSSPTGGAGSGSPLNPPYPMNGTGPSHATNYGSVPTGGAGSSNPVGSGIPSPISTGTSPYFAGGTGMPAAGPPSSTTCQSVSVVCGPDGKIFSLCGPFGTVPMGNVPEGTKCVDGTIGFAEAQAAGFPSMTSCQSGSMVCGPDGKTFTLCSPNNPAPMMNVPEGTKCVAGGIVSAR